MATIRAVIFDLGNVLVRWNPRHLYRQLFPATDEGRAAMEQFLAEVVPLDTFNRRVDLGEDIATLCEEFVAAHPMVDPNLIRSYAHRQHEMWAGTIDGTVAIHAALRTSGVPLYALSNWGRDFALAEETFPVLKQFDGRIISHHVGVVKPEPEIFHILLSRFSLRADQCLFIDDSAQNIVAADALGFHTHRFSHPIRLAAHLDEIGVLPIHVSSAWESTATSLDRTFVFADFNEAWTFMSSVAVSAEQLGHHPDWSNSWNTVSMKLTTHDQGNKVTHLDRALAAETDQSVRTAVASRASDLAVRFNGHLMDGDIETAHAMLSSSLRSAFTVTEFHERWLRVCEPNDDFTRREFGLPTSEWGGRSAHQIQKTSVAMFGRSHQASMTATTAFEAEPKHVVVDAFEFSRP
jgi:2-haloacid dehalogenase